MRILVIGQGPSKSGEGKAPLDGFGSGDRLADLAGLTRKEMLKRCTALNLLNEWHGKNGKGDKFPMDLAKKSAETLRVAWDNYDRVLLLGENVAKAFAYQDAVYFHTYTENECKIGVHVIPHPSGINRWYNKKENWKAAQEFLSTLFSNGHVEVVRKGDRKERAEYCTKYLETFESTCRNWVDLATVLVEVEKDELFLEVGAKTWDDWAKQHAPVSYRLCYMIKARYKALKEAFSLDEMKKIPPETAQWASQPKNLSPAVLKKPEVKAALMQPHRMAVAALKEVLPDQHIEGVKRVTAKFAVSQYEVVHDAHEAFRHLKDDKASFEDFIEFVVSEWMESPHPDGGSVREQWEKVTQ